MGNIVFYAAIALFLAGTAYATLPESEYLMRPTRIGALLPYDAFAALLTFISAATYRLVKHRSFVVVAIGSLAFGIGVVRALMAPSVLPAAFMPLLDTKSEFSGVLVAQPDLRETSARLRVEISHPDDSSVTTGIIASAPPYGEYVIGDQVRVGGTLTAPEPFATDGGRTFAYDRFLAKDGVFGVMQPAHAEVVGRDPSLAFMAMRPLQAAREGFMRAVGRALPEPESALAAGLIVGGKQGLGEDLLDDFTIAGLLPIVVLSGYNVMIIAEGILKALSFLPKRTSLALAAVSIALFVLAAGAGASSIRAGLMALLALLARATGRTYAVVRALFVTLVLMVLASPLTLLYDPGLQFSFVATLGLIVGAPITVRWFGWIANAFMRDIVASTIAAQIAVLPLLLWQTGNLSLVSVGANVLVLPVIPLAMAASGIAAAIAFVPGALMELVAIGVGLPAYALLAYVIVIAERAADLPHAMLVIPKFPFWIVVFAYAGLGIFVARTTHVQREDSQVCEKTPAQAGVSSTHV